MSEQWLKSSDTQGSPQLPKVNRSRRFAGGAGKLIEADVTFPFVDGATGRK
jgi:hypothetical protein